MEQDKREALAERLLAAGALAAAPGGERPLRWSSAPALEEERLRRELARELAELVREHYSAADAVVGGPWAEAAGELPGLPPVRRELTERPVLVLGSSEELEAWLPRLVSLRRSGGNPAAAVIWNEMDESLRAELDRADIRCHWLTDLENGAAAALQSGALDFAEYCRLFPQA